MLNSTGIQRQRCRDSSQLLHSPHSYPPCKCAQTSLYPSNSRICPALSFPKTLKQSAIRVSNCGRPSHKHPAWLLGASQENPFCEPHVLKAWATILQPCPRFAKLKGREFWAGHLGGSVVLSTPNPSPCSSISTSPGPKRLSSPTSEGFAAVKVLLYPGINSPRYNLDRTVDIYGDLVGKKREWGGLREKMNGEKGGDDGVGFRVHLGGGWTKEQQAEEH